MEDANLDMMEGCDEEDRVRSPRSEAISEATPSAAQRRLCSTRRKNSARNSISYLAAFRFLNLCSVSVDH